MPVNPLLLGTAYFAPVHFYSRFISHKTVYIEKYENFSKQTFRNRCVILGANGKLPLVVPVIKGRSGKYDIKDIQISYDENWQRAHWRSIFSAYNSSPFFEFYSDEIYPVFQKRWDFLFDMNMYIHDVICGLLQIESKSEFTEDFEKVPSDTSNLREIVTPKRSKQNDPFFHPKKYTQVFSEKFGFIPNLSILDLLFNEGPTSHLVLEESLKQED